jgi:hypothetical protein
MSLPARIALTGFLALLVLLSVLVYVRTQPGGNYATSLIDLLLPNPPNSSVRSRFSGTNRELRMIYDRLQNYVNFQIASGITNAFESAIVAIGEADELVGYDYFRLATGTNHVLVALNPKNSFWLKPDAHQDKIAAYWPMAVMHPTNGITGFVAVHFGGVPAFITNPPIWKPIEIPPKKSATGK